MPRLTQAIPNGPVNAVTGSGTNLLSDQRRRGSHRSGGEVDLYRRVPRRRRVRDLWRRQPRLPLHPSDAAVDSRRHRPVADGRLLPRHDRQLSRLLHHQPRARRPPVVQCCGSTTSRSRTRSTPTTRSKSPSTSGSADAGARSPRIATAACGATSKGFFRSDNGQSDPAISSLFDFPTNDPSYVGRRASTAVGPVTSATRAAPSAAASCRTSVRTS